MEVDHSVRNSWSGVPMAKEMSVANSREGPSELHNLYPSLNSYNMLDLLHNNQSLIGNVRYLDTDLPDREQRLVERLAMVSLVNLSVHYQEVLETRSVVDSLEKMTELD